ncbi:MAG: GAF domain-containing protein [Pyrinomonadaceae bacterium]|nr:GAF domain-containing protein [Pyrinomonadaceae bacterium]
MKPPIPGNEAERLRLLQIYKVLDTASEKTLDDLTELAAAICETPIGLISLVDEHRQWFKSRYGLDAAETPRDHAFCAYAILDDQTLVVEDATKDRRFAQNPLVLQAPSIKFYAGAPLIVSDGIALGTLCVIDHKPRKLSEMQMKALETLSRAVVTQLDLRRSQVELLSVERLVPMCAWCRNVRSQDGEWKSPEKYFENTVPITHGACPDCAENFRRSSEKPGSF